MLFPKPPSNNNKAPITIDFATATLKRRDIWESREDALNLLLFRGSTKNWDPAVVKNFVVSKQN